MNEMKQTKWAPNETSFETTEGFEQSANWIENLKHSVKTTLLKDFARHQIICDDWTPYEGLSTKLNTDSLRYMRLWSFELW